MPIDERFDIIILDGDPHILSPVRGRLLVIIGPACQLHPLAEAERGVAERPPVLFPCRDLLVELDVGVGVEHAGIVAAVGPFVVVRADDAIDGVAQGGDEDPRPLVEAADVHGGPLDEHEGERRILGEGLRHLDQQIPHVGPAGLAHVQEEDLALALPQALGVVRKVLVHGGPVLE